MARLISGCVDWSDNTVYFDEVDCDDNAYTGCMVWTGEHAGHVAVVGDGLFCDDTYYGCIDWGTGAFKVLIPDDCGCDIDPVEWPTQQCGNCSEISHQPGALAALIQGNTNLCGDGECIDCSLGGGIASFMTSFCCDGVYIFTKSASNHCLYILNDDPVVGSITFWNDLECEGGSSQQDIKVLPASYCSIGDSELLINISTTTGGAFWAEEAAPYCMQTCTGLANILATGDCCGEGVFSISDGGSAWICPVTDT